MQLALQSRPDLAQVQTQRMAPQMIQSLRFLQAPLPDLRDALLAELARNPALEELPASPAPALSAAPPSPAPSDSFDPDRSDDFDADDYAREQESLESAWLPSAPAAPDDPSIASDRHDRLLESLVSSESLSDHLHAQLDCLALPPDVARAADWLIGALDANGWLSATPADAAAALRIPLPAALEALRLLQTFDPPGVAAASLSECLLLQLRAEGNPDDSLPVRLVRDHLPDLAAALASPRPDPALTVLARRLHVPPTDLAAAAALIRTLDPRPGARWSSRPAAPVYPEVEIVPNPDPAAAPPFVARLLDDALPALRIAPRAEALLDAPSTPTDARRWLRTRIRDGRFLLSAVEQRRTTLLRIASLIAETQTDFFLHGPTRLRAMTLAPVAAALGVHPTTVGRAVAGKYAATPRGTLELRSFFSSGVPTSDGETLSAAAVKAEIERLVKNENPAHPLSDLQLADALRSLGPRIARRTVAKYREQLQIPPSHLRRRT